MGPIRRTINLILALALAAAGIRKPLQERTLIGLPAPVANHSSMMHRNAVLERVRAHADQSSEATRVHHASRRRGGLAARGTRAGGTCRLLLGGRAKSTELQVSHARTSLSCWLRRARAIDFFSLRRLPRVMLDESKMPASRRLNSGAIYVIHTGRLAPRLNDRWVLQ
jgi:hypothetical protein